jgi:transcription initiation factor TFIIIB Brf1 subunit/transcription initiation factor TFIIB
MKPKRVRLGRKPAMDSRLAISVGFALGCDLSLSEVAEIAGVSEATIVRYMNKSWLSDARCKCLQDKDRRRKGA